jgi:catechol 2,3-dioxygenase-like lactoylglutathione lyase family enzyme
MPNNAYHHIALRVADIEKAAQFYVDAFGAQPKTKAAVFEGDFAGIVMGGVPDCRFKVQIIGFDTGVVELFEFLQPVEPTGGIPSPSNQLLHFCVQVDEIHSALERVEAAGGKRYWPQPEAVYAGIDVVYVTDPDGNVIELITGSMDDVVAGMIDSDPALAPDALPA